MEGLEKATGKVSLSQVTPEVEVELIGRATMSLHPLHLYLKFLLLCVSSLHNLSRVSELGCRQLCTFPLCSCPSFHGTAHRFPSSSSDLQKPKWFLSFFAFGLGFFPFFFPCSVLNALKMGRLHKCKANQRFLRPRVCSANLILAGVGGMVITRPLATQLMMNLQDAIKLPGFLSASWCAR